MENDNSEKNLNVFKGLKALSDSSFPKRCGNCGRVFETAKQYLEETENLNSGIGMKASYDDDDKSILEVYRNCICGSTLMDFFSDRRDLSEKGVKRRENFQKVLNYFEQQGIDPQIGREEILKFMRTGESSLLKQFGVKGRIHKV
ncbi:MAG: hypothetical protein PVI90_02930 [Desulfobacteraceae bacterium]|jgi:hypothetical protein